MTLLARQIVRSYTPQYIVGKETVKWMEPVRSSLAIDVESIGQIEEVLHDFLGYGSFSVRGNTSVDDIAQFTDGSGQEPATPKNTRPNKGKTGPFDLVKSSMMSFNLIPE